MRRWTAPAAARRLIPALLALLAAGCAGPLGQPTLIAPAALPALFATATQPRAANSAGDAAAAQAGRATQSSPGLATLTPTVAPRPSGTGIRPDQAPIFHPAGALPEAPLDWRPPPMAAPLALHPDDHYWLIRPIPSGSRNFDLEWYPYGSEPLVVERQPYRVHHGLDFPNDTGTPILAAGSGVVLHAGPLPSERSGVNYYGNTVIIHHDWQWRRQDVFTLYAHTLELFVNVGDYVQQGQLIAGVGASGEVSGPHLHLEVRVGQNDYNHTRNPALWLAPYEGWGTLAGRFIDRRGHWIYGGRISIYPEGSNAALRTTRAYMTGSVTPDDVWNENFVVPDLPAGRYLVHLAAAGQTFRRTVDVMPGRTNFIVVQADFAYEPTATPPPTPTPTATPTPTPTP